MSKENPGFVVCQHCGKYYVAPIYRFVDIPDESVMSEFPQNRVRRELHPFCPHCGKNLNEPDNFEISL